MITCKNCGHMLALPSGALAKGLEKPYRVQIWCVKCGKLTTVDSQGSRTGQRVNFDIVRRYKNWEV